MQTQTVFRAGNSNVVTIPKELSKELGIKPGQKVIVEKTETDDLVVRKISAVRKEKKFPDQEFKKWWKAFLKDNAGVLDELAIR